MNTRSENSGETAQLIESTARRVLGDHCAADQLKAAEGGWSEKLWQELEASGLTQALEPPGTGEMAVPVEDALSIVRLAGEYCAPVPLAESLIAQWVIKLTGLPAVVGPLTVAPVNGDDRLSFERAGGGWHVSGSAARVPWGRFARAVVACGSCDGRGYAAVVPTESLGEIIPGENLAREPRDRVVFDCSLQDAQVRPLEGGRDYLFAIGAAIRVLQMAGGLDAALRMTVEYVTHRKQFGRPLGKFQAIQQNVAVMAAHTAAARTAANSVSQMFSEHASTLGVAAAKLRTNEAVGIVARLAHQAHGAMGFTREYGLHFVTKRLWSWRDEFGSENVWGRELGRSALSRGPDHLWSLITSEMG